ncbi:MAG: hypothetical protein Q7T71_19970 [Herbiconiux sp.]|nr:hypothetical protein [Herbiconiux sp.]
MTAVLVDAPTVSLVWATPEPKLWVATELGEYAGMVEFADGHFTGYDRTGRSLGSHSSLPEAQAALTGHRAPRLSALPLPYVAVVVGTVAVSLSAMSLAAIAA